MPYVDKSSDADRGSVFFSRVGAPSIRSDSFCCAQTGRTRWDRRGLGHKAFWAKPAREYVRCVNDWVFVD
jgi:hypothetical protein